MIVFLSLCLNVWQCMATVKSLHARKKLFEDRYSATITWILATSYACVAAMYLGFLLPFEPGIRLGLTFLLGIGFTFVLGKLNQLSTYLNSFYGAFIGTMTGAMVAIMIRDPALCGLPIVTEQMMASQIMTASMLSILFLFVFNRVSLFSLRV